MRARKCSSGSVTVFLPSSSCQISSLVLLRIFFSFGAFADSKLVIAIPPIHGHYFASQGRGVA